MASDKIFEQIEELKTPVGAFCVFDGDKKIAFSVEKNLVDMPSEVVDENDNVIGTVNTDTNYRIVIPTDDLEIGKDYMICFSDGKWEFCDSDEHTICYDAVIGDWVVGIGAYDPNDIRKEDQIMKYSKEMGFLEQGFAKEPDEYDESEFTEYTVEPLSDFNGFRFKLFDKTTATVYFEVAWIKIGEYPTLEYEGAIGLWLC